MFKIPSIGCKRPILFTCFLTFLFFDLIAQSPPQLFNYQAVVRNAMGDIVPNQAVGFRISILQGTPGGTSVYEETHTVMTNAFGIVNLEIGNGTTSNDFSGIDWSNGPYFIKVEVDPAGGTNYNLMGTQQLLSVPYALYANKAANADLSYQYLTEPQNEELITTPETAIILIPGMTITPPAGTYSISLSLSFQTANSDFTQIGIYKDNTLIGDSIRDVYIVSSDPINIQTQTIVQVNGNETIEAKFQAFPGVFVFNARTMILLRLGD